VLGNEVVYEAGKAVELALRGATLEDNVTIDDIAPAGKVLHHPGAQNSGIGRTHPDQPHTVDFARLSERASLQQHHGGADDNPPK
jgi:hypothetical protein